MQLTYLRGLQSTFIAGLGDLEVSPETLEQSGDFLLAHLTNHVDGMENLKSVDFWKKVRA